MQQKPTEISYRSILNDAHIWSKYFRRDVINEIKIENLPILLLFQFGFPRRRYRAHRRLALRMKQICLKTIQTVEIDKRTIIKKFFIMKANEGQYNGIESQLWPKKKSKQWLNLKRNI